MEWLRLLREFGFEADLDMDEEFTSENIENYTEAVHRIHDSERALDFNDRARDISSRRDI